MNRRPQSLRAVARASSGKRHELGFFKSLYAFHHTHRFEWLRRKITSLPKESISVLEVGCADARSLDYVPVHVNRYYGLDAGWRSGVRDGQAYGLEAAKRRFTDRKTFTFRQSVHYSDLQSIHGKFDVEIVLETFEYLEVRQLESYIRLLAEKLERQGNLFSTMPNEKGLPLLVKAIGARLSGVPRSEYTRVQFFNAVLGRLDRVPRSERGRRGFDYEAVADLVRRYFPYVRLEPVGALGLPRALSPNIGLIASHDPNAILAA
jgi:hypothetical protein